MTIKDLFLLQHGAVHSVAVGGNRASAAERTFGGLTDEQMRVRPREDLNSLAWIMFHIARAEDIFLNPVVAGRDQVFDDGWAQHLGITRRDFGIGMTSAEVTDLTRQIDVGALREYRDAVGTRTRQIVSTFADGDWEGDLTEAALQRAAVQGAFGSRAEGLVKVFSGRPRAAVLTALALSHCSGHMGEAVTVRSAGGFGTGI